MFDVHVHFNSNEIYDELETNIKEIKETFNNNYKAIVVGYDDKSNQRVIELINKFDFMYGAIGIHPSDCKNYDFSMLEKIRNEILENKKIVAIGEIGLDTDGDFLLQREKFIRQIELANFLRLPIIIHSKNSNERVLKIIKYIYPQYGFVFHCFQPDIDIAKEIIKLGGYLSFATPITRINARKSLEVIKLTPIEKILIELDYPYMSIDPINDGQRVFNRIKELKRYSHDDLEKQLDENAKRLFRRL